ncbi:MAG: hypothetical protein NTW86_16520, partial [Candidatus Sumerlaeota bacterium]|nr:hypothetical protein [Candidatus Sumerlaeota bacterium]
MNGEGETRRRSRLRAALNRPVGRLLPTHSLIVREARAASSAVAAMVVLTLLVGLHQTVISAFSTGSLVFSSDDYWGAVAVAGIILGLLLGVLCGAEELENGTADFARRLPIPWPRIFVEKVAGSLIAFVAWLVMVAALGTLAEALYGER